MAEDGSGQERKTATARTTVTSKVVAILVASGALATLTGLVLNRFFDTALDQGADALGAAAIRSYPQATRCESAHLALTAPLSPTIDIGKTAPRPANTVCVGNLVTDVVIEGNRNEQILITAINAVIHRSEPMLTTGLIHVPEGGPGPGPVLLGFDFDRPDTAAMALGDDGKPIDQPFLDRTSLTLAYAEKLRLRFAGRTAAKYVQWSIKIDFLVGGQVQTVRLFDEEPLQVTGFAPLTQYRERYEAQDGTLTRTA
ncbi:MAG TPA: hypothetical protein VF062_29250 [Candidatus Limnocylindrales bacterium]